MSAFRALHDVLQRVAVLRLLDMARALAEVRLLVPAVAKKNSIFFRAMRCAVRSRYENEPRKCILAISDSDAARVGAAVE